MSTWLTARQLASAHGVRYGTLDIHLRKWRSEHKGEWEPPNPKAGKPAYTYNPVLVIPIIEEMRKHLAQEVGITRAYHKEVRENIEQQSRIEKNGEWLVHPTEACRFVNCSPSNLRYIKRGKAKFWSGRGLTTVPVKMRNGHDVRFYLEKELIDVKKAQAAVPSAGASDDEITLEQAADILGLHPDHAYIVLPNPKVVMRRRKDGTAVRRRVYSRKRVEDFAEARKNKVPADCFTQNEAARILKVDRVMFDRWAKGIQPELARPLVIQQRRDPCTLKYRVRNYVLKSDVEAIQRALQQPISFTVAEGVWWPASEFAKHGGPTKREIRNAAKLRKIVCKRFPAYGRSWKHPTINCHLVSGVEKQFDIRLLTPTPAVTPPNKSPQTDAAPNESGGRRGPRWSDEVKKVYRECYEGMKTKTLIVVLHEVQKEFPEPEFTPPKTTSDVSKYAKRWAKRKKLPWPLPDVGE